MKTPVYVFDREEIKNNYRKICSKIKNANICYASKANSEEEILRVLAGEGAWFECASKDEFDAVIKLGVSPERIIFGLPIKTIETIKYVYDKGESYFVFEELSELDKLVRYAAKAKKIMRLNVNDIVSDTIDFGIGIDEIYENEGDWLRYVDGISFHISNNTNVEVYKNTLKRVREVLKLLNERKPQKYMLNIGGGFHLDVADDFYNALNKENEELRKEFDVDIFAEPGEAIVGSAGKFYTTVILTKQNGKTIDIYMDSGIPQGYAARRNPSEVNIYGEERLKDKKVIYRFMDCTCMGIALFIKRMNKDIRDGDVLEFEGCGAYSTAFCNDFHAYEKCQIIYQ